MLLIFYLQTIFSNFPWHRAGGSGGICEQGLLTDSS